MLAQRSSSRSAGQAGVDVAAIRQRNVQVLEETENVLMRAGIVPRLDLCAAHTLVAHMELETWERPRCGLRGHVVEKDCVDLAKELVVSGESDIWLLNMASSSVPGGGARKGARAQEEHLCRCSNLLEQLTASRGTYPLVRPLGEHQFDLTVLEHKEVTFVRDGLYHLLPEPEWFTVSVLSASAHNEAKYGALPVRDTRRRIEFLLQLAEYRGARHLVLSAWGCGAFGQNPRIVAAEFREALLRRDSGTSRMTVTFAIRNDHNGPANVEAFREELARS